jgi:hypothetical protein
MSFHKNIELRATMQLWQSVLSNVAKETGISWATNAIFGLYELFSCIVAEVSGYSSATISWPILWDTSNRNTEMLLQWSRKFQQAITYLKPLIAKQFFQLFLRRQNFQ